ncbi:MAG: DUF1848 domain-containing protein [Azospirillaceae bacterium]
MIVSASYRTDIPAFYGRWFLARLAEGRCAVPNPYGSKPYTVRLDRDAVDGFVFWTKNLGPFAEALATVEARGTPYVVQYTVTGYPRALETSVTDAARAVGHIRDLAARHGPRAAVWRYDPILVTDLTETAWHRDNFAALAGALAGAVDEVVVSFAQLYAKTRRNTDAAARRAGFSWRDPPDDEKRALAADLAAIAAEHGMALTLCTQPALLADLEAKGAPVNPARCVDAGRLSDLAGRPIGARTKGNRPGCLCAESRDIGVYDTCPHGCVYCYAVRHRDKARRAHRAHDPAAPSLAAGVGWPPPHDPGGSLI